jgi:type I restriction enzyme, S subunit
VNPAFVHLAFAEPSIRRHVESLAKSTSGVNNINSEQLKALTMPIPCLSEQAEIVRHAESAFAQIDHVAVESARATRFLDRLDQATLDKAFRGELLKADFNAANDDSRGAAP